MSYGHILKDKKIEVHIFERVNLSTFVGVADQYKNELDVKLCSLPNISDNKWKDIAQATNDTALTVLGKKPKYRFHVNDEIARLSKQQQQMRLKIDNVTDNTTKNSLRKYRSEIMKTIHQRMKELD